jgi:hypothetical protein
MPPPQPQLRHLVVLEDSQLAAMAANPTILHEFPFLGAITRAQTQVQATVTKKRCGKCRGTNQARAQALANVRQIIGGMPSDRKRRMRELLNAKQIRVVWRKPNGAREVLTIS